MLFTFNVTQNINNCNFNIKTKYDNFLDISRNNNNDENIIKEEYLINGYHGSFLLINNFDLVYLL
jgi:hypothetical protein